MMVNPYPHHNSTCVCLIEISSNSDKRGLSSYSFNIVLCDRQVLCLSSLLVEGSISLLISSGPHEFCQVDAEDADTNFWQLYPWLDTSFIAESDAGAQRQIDRRHPGST